MHISAAWRLIAGALLWFIIISLLHFRLNFEHEKRKVITMGYMPVITNLAAPLLDHVSNDSGEVYFKALKFNSFAEMAEALRNDKIQAAFMIAPLAIVLRQQGEDVKVVYIGNRHESSLVTRKELNISTLADLSGKTVAVPIRYSGHNISLLKLMKENGLSKRINIVEMNPPDMASAMISGSLDAYYVGEPFAAQSLKNESATLLFHVEEVWDSFVCNLILVKQTLIDNDPVVVKMLVEGAARSGLWAEKHPRQAAEIASRYWNQPLDLVEYTLTEPKGRIVYDRFVPQQEEMQEIADLMVQFDLADNDNIEGLVEDRFAGSVNLQNILDLEGILGGNTKKYTISNTDQSQKNQMANTDQSQKNQMVNADQSQKNQMANTDQSQKNQMANTDQSQKNQMANTDQSQKNQMANTDQSQKNHMTNTEQNQKNNRTNTDQSQKNHRTQTIYYYNL